MFTEHTADLSVRPGALPEGRQRAADPAPASCRRARASDAGDRAARAAPQRVHAGRARLQRRRRSTPRSTTMPGARRPDGRVRRDGDRREMRRRWPSPSAAGSRCGWRCAHPDLVEHLVLEGPAGLRDKGTGGVPADPEGADARALLAIPSTPRRRRAAPQVLADTQRVRDGYVGGIDYDKALHEALPGIKARTLIVHGHQGHGRAGDRRRTASRPASRTRI